MKQFIPLEKQSKKAQRAAHQQKRKSWNGVNPVTKKDVPKTVYNRKRTRQRNDEHFSGGFFYDVLYIILLFGLPQAFPLVCQKEVLL